MYQCKSCGGNLRFDIKEQKLLCDYCGSSYDPADYDEGEGADESDEFGVTIFTCQQCGAELVSTDVSATGFCSYCGASTVLSSRLGTSVRPKYITPFKKTKEDCKAYYSDVIRRAWYAPRELRDPEFLERFRGIYMPYWLYRIHFNPNVSLPAKRTKSDGDYTITEELNVSCDLRGSYGDIPYDASSSFDDEIAGTIAPFSAKKLKPFKPAYLAGFYADTADVDRVVYRQDAIDRAGEYAMDVITSAMATGGVKPERPASKADIERALGTKCEYPEGAFLPVWFLTWRKKDRLAYAIVNGETGKVAADIPVDLRRYFAGTLLIAAALFVLMNFMVSMTAPTALLISSFLAVAASWQFFVELRSVMRKENHIEDKGFFAKGGSERSMALAEEEEKRQRTKGKVKKAGSGSFPTFLIYPLIILGYTFLMDGVSAVISILSSMNSGLLRIGSFAALAAGGYFFVKSTELIRDVKEKSMLIPAATSFLAEGAAFGVFCVKPFEDWIYYAGAILCLAGVTVTCVELIRRHNLIATRPVPEFFNREGGNDRKENDGRTGIVDGADGGGKAAVGADGFVKADGITGGAAKGGGGGGRILSRIKIIFLAALLGGSALIGAATAVRVSADKEAPLYRNEKTGYEVYINDRADLLTAEEEQKLLEDMKPVTAYGGAAFVSGYFQLVDTPEAAESEYRGYFGKTSGTLFIIDMGNRNIYIFSDGAIYNIVSKPYANTITDNTYRYATMKQYYACASEVFSEIFTLLEGGRISQPMKYITNALIALILSLLINYGLVRWTARTAKPSKAAVLGAITAAFAATGTRKRVVRTTRRYTGSSSSGGGFSGGGGGGFSGGGSSGGGGGHGF